MAGTTRESSTSSPDLLGRSAGEAPLRWCARAEDQELFVYVYLGDVTRVGLFLPTYEPHPIGTRVDIVVSSLAGATIRLRGSVQWINPWRTDGNNINPGMGVLLEGLESELRERLVNAVYTLVFLR